MTKVKVVLDTNVYLSGIIFGGNSRHILDLIISKRISAFTSPSILLEISQKLEKKFKWKKNQVLTTVKTLAKSATIVYPREKLTVIRIDKSDNKILEAALKTKANYVITGDKHLLKVERFRKIKILSPAKFLLLYSKGFV